MFAFAALPQCSNLLLLHGVLDWSLQGPSSMGCVTTTAIAQPSLRNAMTNTRSSKADPIEPQGPNVHLHSVGLWQSSASACGSRQ